MMHVIRQSGSSSSDEEEFREFVTYEDAQKLTALFAQAASTKAILLWDGYGVPSCVSLYANTGGDEDYYALCADEQELPWNLENLSSMSTQFEFVVDGRCIGTCLVCHHS